MMGVSAAPCHTFLKKRMARDGCGSCGEHGMVVGAVAAPRGNHYRLYFCGDFLCVVNFEAYNF